MKKIFSILMCGGLILGLTGCGDNSNIDKNKDDEKKTEEVVKNKVLECNSGDSGEDYERTYNYIFTYDKDGKVLENVTFEDSITYFETKLSDYNINENKKWCNDVGSYGGVKCVYTINDDKNISVIRYEFELLKLDEDGKDVLESEVNEGLDNYNFDSLKQELKDSGMTCK